jgi:hypothetical protein
MPITHSSQSELIYMIFHSPLAKRRKQAQPARGVIPFDSEGVARSAGVVGLSFCSLSLENLIIFLTRILSFPRKRASNITERSEVIHAQKISHPERSEGSEYHIALNSPTPYHAIRNTNITNRYFTLLLQIALF